MKQEQENLLTLLETIILMQMLIENLELRQAITISAIDDNHYSDAIAYAMSHQWKEVADNIPIWRGNAKH